MADWSRLPRELQEMIFSELYCDPERRPKHHVLSKCASVCRSWQYDFEHYTFQGLALSQSCLPKFQTMVGGKRRYRLEYIELLRLRVKLDEYDCSACQTAEDEKTIKKNCITFTNAVWGLLKILSTWKEPLAQARSGVYEGLELEISIHSPSDYKHVFRHFCLQDDYPHVDCTVERGNYEALRRRQAEEAAIHDPPHGWHHGILTVPNPSGNRAGNPSSKDRLFGTRPLDFDFSCVQPRPKWGIYRGKDRRLPRASIVRCLTVRRSSFRGFSAKVLFKLLHESFTHITMARIERWLEIYTDQQAAYEQEFQQLLRKRGLPKTLKNFYLLQESDYVLHQCIAWTGYDASLGFQLCRASRHLEHLAITWQADAETFFHEFFPDSWDGASPGSPATEKWENLRTLSLTCSSLAEGGPPERKRLRWVLRAACTAARLMPRLRYLEMWNCGGGSAALFAFDMREGKEGPPEILWTSSWPTDFLPQDKVFLCWRDLARGRDVAAREPRVFAYTTLLPTDQLQLRWGLLRRLGQPRHLLHPVSLHQVEWETFERSGQDQGRDRYEDEDEDKDGED